MAQTTPPAARSLGRRVAHGGGYRHPRVPVLRATAAAATSEQEFFDQLRAAGLLLRLRVSGTNQVTGYAVALPDHHSAARHVIWYGGAQLAHDLTLGQLRRRWNE